MDGATGWCEGCLRTLDEIAAWSGMSDEQKQRVWSALPLRRAQWRCTRLAAPDSAVGEAP
jgi:predicted Fe-S protein YdhL (DUF1289 family)